MKKQFFLIIAVMMAISAVSCSQELEEQYEVPQVTLQTKASKQSSQYVYNTSANVWMMPQEDPYDITSLRQLAGESANNSRIAATHYALKIYPRNEEELEEILHMDDISVSYIPFGYEYVPFDDSVDLDPSCIVKEKQFKEEERYFIDYDGVAPQQPLPVLYVAWKISKPLPYKYDYSIEYKACLPNNIEESNLECNDGVSIAKSLRGTSNRVLTGYIYDYDDLLNTYVPVRNLKLRLSHGLNTINVITNNSGYFAFSGNINDNATLQLVFENTKWRISNSSLFTYVESCGTVNNRWGSGTHTVIYTNTNVQALHRGADYFYNGSHGINTPSSSYSLRINMLSNGESGCFTASLVSSPWIDIKIASYYDDADYVSHVLHELGHFNHYQINGGFLGYGDVHSLIKESYADFISWHLSHGYYKWLNSGVYNSSWDFYLTSSNQYWKKTQQSSLGCYSPLFIDLVDNYNQRTAGNDYNNDLISGVSPSSMPGIVMGKKTWPEFKSYLSSYLSGNYSNYMISEFVEPYDYYISHYQ